MTSISFDFVDSFEVESRDASVTVPVGEVSTEMAAKIFAYGLSSVLPDAANGAPRAAAVEALGDKGEKEKPEAYEKRLREWAKLEANKAAIVAKTESLMQARLDNILKGVWSVRGTGGMSRRERIIDTLVRAAAKALLGSDWEAFEKLDDATQNAKVKTWYEGNKEAFDAAADKRIAELDRQKAERDALRGNVSISL